MIFLRDSIIVSLKQAIEASILIEKLIWICLGTLGTVYFGYLLVTQVNSWDENAILDSQHQMRTNEIDFPAITFCTKSSNKYGIAERFGNALNPNSDFVKNKLLPFRNEWIKEDILKNWKMSKHIYVKKCTRGKYEEAYCNVSLLSL